MPVIVAPEDYEEWLDPKADSENLLCSLAPYPQALQAEAPQRQD
jgi:putative SOS response-associated peptidase YedK